jgi:hypothetical protein
MHPHVEQTIRILHAMLVAQVARRRQDIHPLINGQHVFVLFLCKAQFIVDGFQQPNKVFLAKTYTVKLLPSKFQQIASIITHFELVIVPATQQHCIDEIDCIDCRLPWHIFSFVR